jgi:hypothetical protein
MRMPISTGGDWSPLPPPAVAWSLAVKNSAGGEGTYHGRISEVLKRNSSSYPDPVMRNRLVVMLFAAVGCSNANGPMSFELAPAEIQTARDLAEVHGPMAHLLRPEGTGTNRAVFVKVELLPAMHPGDRQALVQHYRYVDDSTVFTHVDLASATIVDTEIEPHYPTGLADEEIVRARKLVRDDPPARAVTEGLTLLPRPRPVTAAGDPMRHHRVVEFLLQRGQESIISPTILVDLTDDRVDVRE